MGAARTIRDLAVQLRIPVGKTWLVRNRPFGKGDRTGVLEGEIPLLGEIPYDPSLPEWERGGRSFLDIPGSSPAAEAVGRSAREMLGGEKR